MPKRNSSALTDPGIRRIAKAPAGQRIEKFDARQPGLALRITDKGTKSWSVYYRFGGKHRRLTLGTWPEVGVAEAREKAGLAKLRAERGTDPKIAAMAEEVARAEAEAQTYRTFGYLAEQYIKREVPSLKRGKETEALIHNRLLPEWEHLPLSDIRKRHAIKLIESVLDEGKPAMAFRVYETIGRIFRWAAKRDEIDANPMDSMEPPIKKRPRQRKLEHKEIRTLWRACDEAGYPWGPIQKLLLLTAQGRDEVASMQWGELDNPEDPKLWRIPAERSKSNREHLVPLSTKAREVLTALPRFTEGDHVFSTTGGRRPVSGFSKAKARTDKLTGLTDWRWHDLRRTARSEMARIGVPDVVAERVLNHAPRGLEGVYNVYEYLDEKRDALERWGRELETIISPSPDNVVSLKEGAADG